MKIKRKKNRTEEERKQIAKKELIVLLVFILFVFAYSKILLIKGYDKTEKNNTIYKVDLSKINHYDFEIELNVDDKKTTFLGTIDNNIGNINSYKIINGEIYNENLEKEENIFNGIDNKYFKLNTISNYLDENNYNNKIYEINTKDIINAKIEDFTIYADVKYESDKIVIKLDYSNLAQIKDNSIKNYIVTYTISNYK